jgi:hypothetical protein
LRALEFYKVAIGFIEITDSTSIPTAVSNRFIESHQIIPIKFTSRLNERWPTTVKSRKIIFDQIFHHTLCNMFGLHNDVPSIIFKLPRSTQRGRSSIYYSEGNFLSDIIPQFDKKDCKTNIKGGIHAESCRKRWPMQMKTRKPQYKRGYGFKQGC